MKFNPFARVTVLVNLTDEPLYLKECQRVVDPEGRCYLPIKLKPNKHTTISASRLLNRQGSSGASRTLGITRSKSSNQNAFEKDFLSGGEIHDCPTIYFYKVPGVKDIEIYKPEGSGGLLAEACRLRLVRCFWRPPLLTKVPENDQNAP